MNVSDIKKIIEDINNFRVSKKNRFVDFSKNEKKVLYKVAIKSVGAKGYTPFVDELAMILLDDSVSFTKGQIEPKKIASIENIKVRYYIEDVRQYVDETTYGSKKVEKILNEKKQDIKIKDDVNIEKKETIENKNMESELKDVKCKWVRTFESIIKEVKDSFLIAKLYFDNGDCFYINLYSIVDYNDDFKVSLKNKSIITYRHDYIIISNIYDNLLIQSDKSLDKNNIFITQNQVPRIEGIMPHISECCNKEKICSEFCYNLIKTEELG